MYLNVYVPQLQSEQGVVRSFKYHRGQPLPSAALMCPLSRGFVAQLERFVTEHRIPLAQFRKREPKGAAMAEHLRRFADSLASVDSRPDTGQPLTHARRNLPSHQEGSRGAVHHRGRDGANRRTDPITRTARTRSWAAPCPGRRELAKVETAFDVRRSTTALVDTGVFRWSRNPVYFSLMLLSFGLALLVNSLPMFLLSLPAGSLLCLWVIRPEESYLEQRFGEPYRAYKATVRRWL